MFGRGLGLSLWEDDWNYFWLVTHPFAYPVISWLHPGTMFEFYALYPIFGTNVLLWQSAGILLKGAASAAVYDLGAVLLGSPAGGIASALIFALLPLGLEAISWPSAYIVLLDVIFLSQAAAIYVRSVQNRTPFPIAGWLWVVLAIVADPMRALFFIWIPLMFRAKSFLKIQKRRMIPVFAVVAALCVYAELAFLPALTKWYGGYWFAGTSHSLFQRFFTYLASVGNMISGWIVPVARTPFDMSRSQRSIGSIVTGAIALMLFVLSTVRTLAGKTKPVPIVVFAGWWIMASIFVQWSSDPDYIISVTHRHFVIPSVGLSLLLAYGIGKLAPVPRWMAGAALVVVSWYAASDAFRIMESYRNVAIVDRNMALLERIVAPSVPSPIVFIDNSGNRYVDPEDYRSHLAFLRSRSGSPKLAMFTSRRDAAANEVCIPNGLGIMDPRISLFGVAVDAWGEMTDITQKIRKEMLTDTDIYSRCVTNGVGFGEEGMDKN